MHACVALMTCIPFVSACPRAHHWKSLEIRSCSGSRGTALCDFSSVLPGFLPITKAIAFAMAYKGNNHADDPDWSGTLMKSRMIGEHACMHKVERIEATCSCRSVLAVEYMLSYTLTLGCSLPIVDTVTKYPSPVFRICLYLAPSYIHRFRFW